MSERENGWCGGLDAIFAAPQSASVYEQSRKRIELPSCVVSFVLDGKDIGLRCDHPLIRRRFKAAVPTLVYRALPRFPRIATQERPEYIFPLRPLGIHRCRKRNGLVVSSTHSPRKDLEVSGRTKRLVHPLAQSSLYPALSQPHHKGKQDQSFRLRLSSQLLTISDEIDPVSVEVHYRL
jgi:hypothetical protein